jgi:HEAT repeat protein
MWNLRPASHRVTLPVGLCALAVLLLGPAVPPALAQPTDCVEQVRQVLPSQVGLDDNEFALADRKARLAKAIECLKTPGEMRRALALTEWKDNDKLNPNVARIDLEARTTIGLRLEKALKTVVEQGDDDPRTADARAAVAIMLGEMGVSIRALDPADQNSLGRGLSPLLVALINNDKNAPRVRQEAARALGKVNPEPVLAVSALQELLKSPNVVNQRAAAEALSTLVTTIYQLQRKGKAQTGVEAEKKDVVAVGKEVVGAAGTCLAKSDAQVRRFGADAIYQTATALNNLISSPIEAGILPPRHRDKWTEREKQDVALARKIFEMEAELFQPLLEALQGQGKAVADTLSDPDSGARVLARRALELLGSARLRILRRDDSVPPTPGEPAPKVGDKGPTDPLALAIKPGLMVIAKRGLDQDIRVRRATLDFLEALEDGAAPAVDVLAVALADPDRFIRWAAARTLGKVGPIAPELTVPPLAKLLGPNEDADVREAVADTLRHYGPYAKEALPALIAIMNNGDAATREAVIRAVISVGGPEASEAIPALRVALKSDNANVRRVAADALGNLGGRAMAAIDDLRDRLMDDDMDVRTAASEAILNILAPRKQ